jgi:malate dehydrogenase (oxaloacetate-decarboxylating)(NADP+)
VKFGVEYLIPKPSIGSSSTSRRRLPGGDGVGVATRLITDFDAYHQQLMQFVYHSGLLMKPIFQAAKKSPKRIVFAEGEDERVLRAVQVVVDEGLAKPILIGRPAVITQRLERFGLRLRPGRDVELINNEDDPRYRAYWTEYHRLTGRKGVTEQLAKMEMRRRQTLIGADDDPHRRRRRHAVRHVRHASRIGGTSTR